MTPKIGCYKGKEFSYYHKLVNVSMYGWKVHVIFSSDIVGARSLPRFEKVLGKDTSDDVTAVAFVVKNWDTCEVFMFLPMREDYRIASEGIIAHECYHCAHTILRSTGVGENEEATAYLLQEIISKVSKFAYKLWLAHSPASPKNISKKTLTKEKRS